MYVLTCKLHWYLFMFSFFCSFSLDTRYSFSSMGGIFLGPCLRSCQSKDLRYEGSWPLRVTRAPEPTDILWENFDTSGKEKYIRRAVSWV